MGGSNANGDGMAERRPRLSLLAVDEVVSRLVFNGR